MQITQKLLLSDIILPNFRGFMIFSAVKCVGLSAWYTKTVSPVFTWRMSIITIVWQSPTDYTSDCNSWSTPQNLTNFGNRYLNAITPVCMAVKSHLRNQRPVVIAASTNDALSAAAKNIGTLRNYKNFYFVPMFQDDCRAKPFSMIADFKKIPQTILEALDGRQIQPMYTVGAE